MAELNNTQYIEDPREQGLQGLSGVRPNRFQRSEVEELGLSQASQALNPGRSMAGYRDDVYRSTPSLTFMGTPGLGDSRFDDKMAWASEFQNLDDSRGKYQSGFEQIGLGVLKGAVLAGTTFLDGLVGTPMGLISLATGGSFVQNPWSMAMQSINQWSEEAMPNYYREHELNSPWYQNIFTANMLGDKILKNLGFAVGAAYSGRVNAGMLSKTLNMGKVRQAYKGAVESAVSGKPLPAGASPMNVVDDLAKSSAGLAHRNSILKMAGSLSAGMGEGRIEAIGNADEYRQEKEAILNEELNAALEAEKYKLMQEPGAEQYFTITEGVDGIPQGLELTPEGYSLIYERHREAHEQGLAQINKDASRVANVAFATNTALLTASDWVQFGQFYAGGYRNARKAASVGRLADGTYAPTTNKMKQALTYIKNPLVEANEEMLQAVSGIGAGYMYNHESYLDAELDPESNRQTMGFIKAMGKAILEQYGDVDNWEEGFIGGIIGTMGVPSFGGIQGGVTGSVRENREAQRYNQKISDALNRAVTPEMVNYYKGLVQNNTYENLKEEALQNDDIYKYKNHEADQLISSIITFSEAGRIQDLIEIIEGFGNINTPEEIAHIKEITTNKETGKSIYDDMQDSEIAKSIKNQADQYKRFINDFSQVSEDLQLIANKDHTAEGLKELTWMSMKVKDWEHRFNNMYKEAREALGDLQVQVNEGGARLASDILAQSPYEFMSNALPQILIEQLAYASETEAIKKAFRELRGKNGPIGELQALIGQLRQRKEVQGGLDSTIQKLQDLQTTIINRALYGKRLYDFMNNPQALQEKQKKVKEKAVKNQEANNLAEEAKEDVPTTEALKGAQTLSEFKDILNSFEIEDTHDDGVSSSAEQRRLAIADRLSKQDHKIAMAYMDIHNTATAMIENIERDVAVQTRDGQESLYATDSINMAKRIVDEMSQRVEDGAQLRSLDEALVNDIIDNVIGRDNEFFERESALGEVQSILKEAVRLIDSADGAVNFINKARANQKSKVNTPGAQGNLKIPSRDEVLGRKEKKQEEVRKVEPEAKKQQSSLKSIPEGQKSSDIGNQMEKRNTATQWPSERNPLQYWKPSFSEHDTASLKANNPIAFKDREGGAPIRAIWDVLAQNGAWKYVNEGNLKINDTISFGIDPKITSLEGVDGVSIFMYKGDQIVGLMPATGAPRYKEMQQFIEALMAEYETFLNENPDKAKERFISKHTSYVTDVLAGRGLYGKANRLLSKVKNINNRPITFSYVNSGVELTPNIEDAGDYIGLSSTQGKEGMLFYRQLGADGNYYPVAINIKHFNDKEFSLSDESNQSTGVYRDLRQAIQGMYDHIVDDKGGFASSKDILNSILYFGGELSFFATTTNRERSVEINIKNDKGEKIHQAFVRLGSKPRPITSIGSDGSVTQTKQTENTLVERDAFIDDVLRVLQGFNPRFQVNGNMLNTPGYNESLVNDGILFTNLMDAIPGSAWFKVAPVKPDGTVYSEKEMGNTTPPTKKNVQGSSTQNTLSGSETVATHVEVQFRGVTYKINKDLSFASEVPVIFKAILEDLALIKMASQGIAPEGTKVNRNRKAGLLRLKRPDNSVVWFSLKSDRENIQGVPQPAVNDVGYLDQTGSQEAEVEYIKSIGEDAYNEQMNVEEKVEPAPVENNSQTSVQGQSPAAESQQAQESNLTHYPEYDDTHKEGVKDWVPVRRSVQGGEGNGYANTFGKKVEIPGFENFDFYIVPGINSKNKYIVIEGSTGQALTLDSSTTIKDAVAWAEERLNLHGLARLQGVLSQAPVINKESPSDAAQPRAQEDIAPKEEVKTPLSRRPAAPPANIDRFSKIAKGAGIRVNENFKDESTVSTDQVLIEGRANPNASFEAFSALAKSIAPKSNGARLTRSDWNSLTAQEREHEINCIAPF